MRGRIFRIKKTTILRLSFILNTLLFFASSILSFMFLKDYDLWFFNFCINMGVHLMVRSFLFRLDSSCYFGFLLFFIGIFYWHSFLFNIMAFYSVFIVLAFSMASFFTSHYFNQPFHSFLSISLILVAVDLLVFLIKLISIWFFLAIMLLIVILLICRYLTLK